MAVLCRRGPATVVVLICAALSIYGALQVHKVRIGDTTEGVPELRPDSRFNRDAHAIASHFTLGVDQLKVIVEGFPDARSEEHTSELQSLMRISYAVFCLKKKKHMNTYSVSELTPHIRLHTQ